MNIQHLLKQAQQMQNQIGKVEKEIEATEYTATAGGDAVKVTLTGKMEVTSIEISEDLLTADSREMLQDTMMIAVNAALAAAVKDKEERMNKITQGVKMPGSFLIASYPKSFERLIEWPSGCCRAWALKRRTLRLYDARCAAGTD